MSESTGGGRPHGIVGAGYDLVSHLYQDDAGTVGEQVRRPGLQRLRQLLPAGASVLDLGCGAGVPVARDLTVDSAVTGVDVSAVQINRARRLVPAATFVQADMLTVAFPRRTF
jgi:cyclopropane fatty-acyl-phospholipid synthase-like methyltransferase